MTEQQAANINRVVIEVMVLFVEFLVFACVLQWALTAQL